MNRMSLAALSTVAVVIAFSRTAPAAAPDAAPTFAKDVAPIFYDRCVACHRPDQVAPMSLITYQDARPWSKAIKRKVTAREMPPWFADPKYGHFANDRSLTPEQIETIVQWVDAGSPIGDPKDLPNVPKFVDNEWVYDTPPDAVIELPIAVHIPAEGENPGESYYIKSPFDRDVFIQADQVIPGNPRVVHHATPFVVEMPDGIVIKDGKPFDRDGTPVPRTAIKSIGVVGGGSAAADGSKLASYVPGRGWERYPEGVGRRLPKGSYIDFNMHYQPTGKPEIDRSKIGIWIAKTPVHREVLNVASMDRGTSIVNGRPVEGRLPNIPPYSENYEVSGVKLFSRPATLYGFSPHMHLRGRDMKFILIQPDGREEVLLNVPKYDFNWQLYYDLDTPIKVPVGSKLKAIAHFDNSLNNKYNPGPDKEVYWSEQSWDEMFSPQFRFSYDDVDLTKTGKDTRQQ